MELLPLFWFVLIAGVTLVTAIFLLLLYSGLFYTYTIRCTVPSSLPRRIAYRAHKGAYKNAGDAFWKLVALVPRRMLFGIYYDDPNTVSPDQTRYVVGSCLSDEEDEQEEEMLKSKGYSICTLPSCSHALVTNFPYRNNLSIYIGAWRVYPSLSQYIKEHKPGKAGPFMEIYTDDCIQYVVILENNEGFILPEVAKLDGSKKDQ